MHAHESDLTTRYTQVLDAVIAAIESLDAASLRLPCAAERCSVGERPPPNTRAVGPAIANHVRGESQ